MTRRLPHSIRTENAIFWGGPVTFNSWSFKTPIFFTCAVKKIMSSHSLVFLQPRVLLHGAAHVVLMVNSLPVNETNKHTVNQLYSIQFLKILKKKKVFQPGKSPESKDQRWKNKLGVWVKGTHRWFWQRQKYQEKASGSSCGIESGWVVDRNVGQWCLRLTPIH